MDLRITSAFRTLALMAGMVLVVGSCVAAGTAEPSGAASGTGSGAAGGGPPITSLGAPSVAAATSPAGVTATAIPAGSAAVSAAELSEANNGTRTTVAVGTDVKLVLHSIYWANVATSDADVLALVGQPVFGPGNLRCIPGTGCAAVVTATFHAVAPGTVTVSAHRTNCAQEQPCPSGQTDFEVTIVVVAR